MRIRLFIKANLGAVSAGHVCVVLIFIVYKKPIAQNAIRKHLSRRIHTGTCGIKIFHDYFYFESAFRNEEYHLPNIHQKQFRIRDLHKIFADIFVHLLLFP